MVSLAAWLGMYSRHRFLFLAPVDTSRLEGSSGFHPQQPLSQNRILALQGQHLMKNDIPSFAPSPAVFNLWDISYQISCPSDIMIHKQNYS